MINKIINSITIFLIIILILGFSGTFLFDYLKSINWFGDHEEQRGYGEYIRTVTVWGARHYWYNWGLFFLFCLSIARLFFKVVNIVEKYKKK